MKAHVLALLLLAGCGRNSENGAGDGSENTPTPTAEPTPTPWDALEGIWEVSGADSIGAYSGEVEIRFDGSFSRVVRFADPVKVEAGRELWWVWQGTATRMGNEVSVSVALQRADFVTRRDALVRTESDAAPLPVTGAFTKTNETVSGTFAADGISATESWKNPRVSAEAPIFVLDRPLVAAHPAPSETFKATSFGLFASYHQVPWVTPLRERPALPGSGPRLLVRSHRLLVLSSEPERDPRREQGRGPDLAARDALSRERVSLDPLAKGGVFRRGAAERAPRSGHAHGPGCRVGRHL